MKSTNRGIGQDGAYLTQLLLEKDYKRCGAYRRTSSVNFWRMQELGVDAPANLHLVGYVAAYACSSVCGK